MKQYSAIELNRRMLINPNTMAGNRSVCAPHVVIPYSGQPCLPSLDPEHGRLMVALGQRDAAPLSLPPAASPQIPPTPLSLLHPSTPPPPVSNHHRWATTPLVAYNSFSTFSSDPYPTYSLLHNVRQALRRRPRPRLGRPGRAVQRRRPRYRESCRGTADSSKTASSRAPSRSPLTVGTCWGLVGVGVAAVAGCGLRPRWEGAVAIGVAR
jgi:hypothetical protein